MEDILLVCVGSWQLFSTKHPKYYIFLATSGKIQFNEDDPNYHDHHQDHHQEPQEGILQVSGGSWQQFSTKHPKYYIFLETSGKIQLKIQVP